MSKIQKKQKEPVEVNYPEYTAHDFIVMEAELNKFAVEREQFVNGTKKLVKFVPVEGEQQWLRDQGALTNADEWTVADIGAYKTARDKFLQYNKWKSRKEYAIKMQAKDLEQRSEEIVNSMQIV